jgi:hypothetical protein
VILEFEPGSDVIKIASGADTYQELDFGESSLSIRGTTIIFLDIDFSLVTEGDFIFV